MMQLDSDVWGINHQWCRFLFTELLRNGVDTYVASTGSRNTALLMALADFPEANVLTHYDERGAAFFALGYARAAGKPAAVISTSGTAVANYYPAVIEASAADIPLIVITADRPIEVRDARTDQVIDQTNIFSNYLRWRFDFPAPEENFQPDHLLTAVDQAVYRAARSSSHGPVHLNICLRKPHVIEPEKHKVWYKTTELLERWKESRAPYTAYAPLEKQIGDDAFGEVCRTLASARRGLIVCSGLRPEKDRFLITELGDQLGWPILADITSGLRFDTASFSSSPVFSHYELYLRDKAALEACRPDVVLHLGGEPVNESVQAYLGASGARYVLINDHPFRQDPRRNVTQRLDADPAAFVKRLLPLPAHRSELLDKFLAAEALAEAVLRQSFDEKTSSQWQLVSAICHEIPGESGLFLGNSLPVREWDRFAGQIKKRIFVTANRGTSGVDGNIACAAGFARGLGLPTTVFTGDVALLHDLNSLSLLQKSRLPMTIVVPNNDGGGIFSFLPTINRAACFEKYFTAPHGLSFKGAAEMYGVNYCAPGNVSEFRAAYREAIKGGQHLIEVHTDRADNVEQQRALSGKIIDALRGGGLL